ncbi:prepilin peptidase [Mesorhizobium sp. M2D.F.Ca.ET.185.01.1.1]|uniref:prepilin peptidase n=1 Tax=unclassified Mesorhizobium TaxID=325217 RepID=UPI000FCAEB71|nr:MULTISPECIES: prepilin peptidase [unclassified Mesorhizobium]TGP74414.1 prepilin peptidase [bacterium M00.F.Ca.ET.227.01.1.1]TGP85100.1 prepilin peptidase [bacterium M00.F.Ca.ET.221.01.1.1]TGP89183.1 prepilin peptidase [bacterium M00.F.Ca.ET.222.01.1.1]TGU12744.1 prepilin peptidase [bacterium M00.F.Ca.ET.163.01.1.1]TGU21338.1 prepilin peptidase [bacterium M00.F.Ca.ET.156.01.1.1]TGU43749.1 prepilin peptidase [bacterium M00.F.Ca.ET.146.01.1.1]TGV67014.1 prepilin peptidase [Mesorhizobium sp.
MSLLLIAALVFKGLAILLLGRVAWLDFSTQRISNRDVLLLLCLGLGTLQFHSLQTGSWLEMGISAIGGVILFAALFPFWLLRKVGAGDVKLMSVMPFLIGGTDLVVFSVLLLAFAIATAAVVKNPFLLPAGMFRHYVQHLDRKGVVPFGVPISAAAICAIALQMYYALRVATSSGILQQLN